MFVEHRDQMLIIRKLLKVCNLAWIGSNLC
jgi:hypothetical protein